MHLNFPFVFSSFLLASVVLADHGGENRSRQHQRVRRYSADAIPSLNWAGAVLDSGDIYDIGGTVTIPTVSSDAGSESGIAIWVGIGDNGDVCGSQGSLFQTGIKLSVNESGSFYTAWYEWYPDYMNFVDISVAPGDDVHFWISMSHDLKASVFSIDNLSNNQSISMTVEGPRRGCTKHAEWIVEDYTVGGSMIPFAKFTPVTFTNAVAFGPEDEMYGPQDAKPYEMYKTVNGVMSLPAYVSSIDVGTVTIQRGSG